MRRALLVVAVSFFAPLVSPAQETAELVNRMKAMEEKIKTLEAEVQELKGQQSALTAAVTAAAPVAPAPQQPAETPATAQVPTAAPGGLAAPQMPTGPLPVYGGASAAASKVFNPDISVIGDFLGGAGNGTPRSTPALAQRIV